MDERRLTLDGNAVAGLLADVLAPEATAMRGRCASCGSVAPVGAQSLYMHPGAPGAVLRCHTCEGVLLVLVRRQGRVRFGLPGLTWLEVDGPAEG
ncbi:MAG: DUF6510 family protein [Candidatus Dormiibacterota bacterium]